MATVDHERRSPSRAIQLVCLVGSLCLLGIVAQQPESEDVIAESRSAERRAMVNDQIRARGVKQAAVLEAMATVPRHLFVPEEQSSRAYRDHPLPIGHDQTISQPYIVALMTELLDLDGSEKVLEIGTGSGYQAAILATLVERVYSIEIVQPLASRAAATLVELGYDNVEVRAGDGYLGWPEQAPFDAIILTAAPPAIPPPLLEQLAIGGRLVAPVGELNQDLVLITRDEDGIERKQLIPVRFVPMTGRAQRP